MLCKVGWKFRCGRYSLRCGNEYSGLGAANEALQQLGYQGPEIAMGYACAYPLGVMGIILSLILIRYICRVNLDKEADDIQKEEEANPHLKPYNIALKVENAALSGKKLSQVQSFLARDFVCSRICRMDMYIFLMQIRSCVWAMK